MDGKPLHLLLAQSHPLLGLLPNHLNLHAAALNLRLHGRKPKRLAAVQSLSLSGSHADAPSGRSWEWVPNAVAALVLQLAVCSMLFLFPSRVRAHGLPPPATAAAATVEEVAEEGDEEWEAALQKWKGKTYSLSVPLRVVALRGSYPATWVKVRSNRPRPLQSIFLRLFTTFTLYPRKSLGCLRFSTLFFVYRILLKLRERGSNSVLSSVLV